MAVIEKLGQFEFLLLDDPQLGLEQVQLKGGRVSLGTDLG
jgi:hypothetical protein